VKNWLAIAAFMLLVALAGGVERAGAVTWHKAGASVYGGACEYGQTGYRGDFLPGLPNSFAELGMGRMLGLPYRAKVRFLLHGRKVTGRKRDIGGGGAHVAGLPRVFDFYEPLLTRLLGYRNCQWTGVVQWRRVR
jgi:hypothetical protein